MRAKLAAALLAMTPLAAQTPPNITTTQADIPAATVGSLYSGSGFQFTANNCGGCTWSIVSPLAAIYNLSISSSGNLSGTLEACSSFWTGNAPCSYSLCNNTFDPMVCPFTVRAHSTSTGLASTQTFAMSISWTPTLSNYLTGLANPMGQYPDFSQMVQFAGLSIPPIEGGGHLVIADPNFRTSSYDNLPAWNAWIDAMKAAGMRIVNIEVDLECLLSNRPSCLNLYAGAISYAHHLGMSVSVNPAYYNTATPTTPSCGDAGCPGGGNGITSGKGGIAGACAAPSVLNHLINSGTTGGYGSGVNDWYTCIANYPVPGLGTTSGMSSYQYILQTWLHADDRFVPVHEPTTQAAQWGELTNNSGATDCSSSASASPTIYSCAAQNIGTKTAQHRTCPEDWWVNFLNPLLNTKIPSWSVPADVVYGVTLDALEMDMTAAYVTYLSPLLASSVDMGMDMYNFDSQRQAEFTAAIQSFQANSHSVFVEEFGPEAWTFMGGPTGGACAIVGIQSCTWNKLNQDFFASLLPFLASQGVTDASLYGTEILGACAPIYPDNAQDTGVLNTVTLAMQNHQYSLSAARLSAILSEWNTTGMIGCTLTGGSMKP